MSTDTRLWHPFADMHAVRRGELVITRGEGAYVWDAGGTRYLDATASLWCVNVGHGRREIVEAAMAQMEVLASYSAFGAFANEPALALAERLAGLAPLDDPRIFFGSGGGDAIDTAAKLARQYWAAEGQPDRMHLISRTFAYHGTHGFGTSLVGMESMRQGYGPLLGSVSHVDHQSPEALDELERRRVGDIAERLEGLERAQLARDRLDHLLARVADVRVPQTRGAVEVALAGVVPEVDALAAHDHQLVSGHRCHVGERVPVGARRRRRVRGSHGG